MKSWDGLEDSQSEKESGSAKTDVYYGSTPRWIGIAIILLAIGIGYLVYDVHEVKKGAAAAIASSNENMRTRFDEFSNQQTATNQTIDALREQLGVNRAALDRKTNELAARVREEQRQSDEALGEKIGQVAQAADAKIGEVASGLTGAKTDIASTQQKLETTISQLTRTTGDLGVTSGLVARTRDDLEALRRLGDRDITEFNLTKSKQFQRVGSIQLRLINVNVKRNRYTMMVAADDQIIEKKDKTAREPVQFYVQGARFPYEIVVLSVTKDKVTGYLSAPKPTR